MCLICNNVINNFIVNNPKQHYDTNHGNIHHKYPPESEICSHTIIAWIIARSKHPYADGELMKENILQFTSILDRSNKKLQHLISQMALSRQTIVRQIGDLSANVTMSFKNDLASSVDFRIALDESTDIQDNPQHAVFVCCVKTLFALKKNCFT